MNKKIASEIAIGILLLLVIVVGGIFWLQAKKAQTPVAEPNPTQQQTQTQLQQPDQPQSIVQQQINDDSNGMSYIQNGQDKITLSLPKDWGNLIVPKMDKYNEVINSPYGTVSTDGQGNIFLSGTGLESEFSKMISDYNFGDRKQYIQAPTITLASYPEQFKDDANQEFGSLTKQKKEKNLQPLLSVFQTSNTNDPILEQKCLLNLDAATACANSNQLRGFWWGNMDQISDRWAVKYFENSTSDLKGVGYFDVSGNGIIDTITSYSIVLINPQKRILVHVYLPLNNIYSFPKTADDSIDYKKAYNYLQNSDDYKNTKLEQFMSEVSSLVSSIKLADSGQNVGCDMTNKTYFEIKELGIKFLVDQSIKDDLIYKYDAQGNVARLSSKSLLAMDSSCGGDSGSLGFITKIKGTPEKSSDPAYFIEAEKSGYLKRLNGSFVLFQGAQAVCTSDEKKVDQVVSLSRELAGKIFLGPDNMNCTEAL